MEWEDIELRSKYIYDNSNTYNGSGVRTYVRIVDCALNGRADNAADWDPETSMSGAWHPLAENGTWSAGEERRNAAICRQPYSTPFHCINGYFGTSQA